MLVMKRVDCWNAMMRKAPATAPVEEVATDEYYHATVNGVVPYGVFVDLSESISGLVHESQLEDSYAVGDDLVVELDERKSNGDLAFVPAGIEPVGAQLERIAPDYDVVRTDQLENYRGTTVQLEAQVAQIRQTGGPTIFQLLDGHGIVPAAGFEAAGVRAYPEVEIGDLVRVTGVEREESTRCNSQCSGSLVVVCGDCMGILTDIQRVDWHILEC